MGKWQTFGRSRGSSSKWNVEVQDALTLLSPGRQTMPKRVVVRGRNYKPRLLLHFSRGNHTRPMAHLGVQALTANTEGARQAIEAIRAVLVRLRTATRLPVLEELRSLKGQSNTIL